MDFKTFAHESLALRDHPGRAYGYTEEQREQYYRDIGAFLDKLAAMRSGLMCREDAFEVQEFSNNFKADPAVLQAQWAVMSGNAKIATAMRQVLGLYKITFPPNHPAIQAGWERMVDILDLFVYYDPQKFKTRAELTV